MIALLMFEGNGETCKHKTFGDPELSGGVELVFAKS